MRKSHRNYFLAKRERGTNKEGNRKLLIFKSVTNSDKASLSIARCSSKTKTDAFPPGPCYPPVHPPEMFHTLSTFPDLCCSLHAIPDLQSHLLWTPKHCQAHFPTHITSSCASHGWCGTSHTTCVTLMHTSRLMPDSCMFYLTDVTCSMTSMHSSSPTPPLTSKQSTQHLFHIPGHPSWPMLPTQKLSPTCIALE